MGIGSYVRSRKAVKASRASLNGIAGHQAAMKALGSNAKPEYSKVNHGEIQIGWPDARHPDSRPINIFAGNTPGQGHVTTYHTNIAPSGRYRGLNLIKRGTSGIEPNVIDRHKPTEDF